MIPHIHVTNSLYHPVEVRLHFIKHFSLIMLISCILTEAIRGFGFRKMDKRIYFHHVLESFPQRNKLPSKDDVLSKLSLSTRFESSTAALGDGGRRTSEDLFRHVLDSLSASTSPATSVFSPAEQQSSGSSRWNHTLPYSTRNTCFLSCRPPS